MTRGVQVDRYGGVDGLHRRMFKTIRRRYARVTRC